MSRMCDIYPVTMTAQPVESPLLPEWMYPPTDGWTSEDLDSWPDLPKHTELIDGALIFPVSPQKNFHTLVMDVLVPGLRASAPPDRWVRREMTIRISKRTRPEPDVVVLNQEPGGPDATWFPAAAAVLVVEIVSPESKDRDGRFKPAIYAEAGIRHFWRIEQDDRGLPVVYVHELDGARYALTGIYHDKLTITVPYDIDIDISKLPR